MLLEEQLLSDPTITPEVPEPAGPITIPVVTKTGKFVTFLKNTWRPFNGYLFGITICCDYFVTPIVLSIVRAFIDIPVDVQLSHIPEGVYILWSLIVGVSAGSRGVEKVKKITSNGPKDIAKNFISGAIGRK